MASVLGYDVGGQVVAGEEILRGGTVCSKAQKYSKEIPDQREVVGSCDSRRSTRDYVVRGP